MLILVILLLIYNPVKLTEVEQREINTASFQDENQFQVFAIRFEEIEEIDPIKEKIALLKKCESGGNPNALNPIDLDGTPSYGCFQFKISTWKNYVIKYNLFNWKELEEADWFNTMWSCDLQEIVVEKMFFDPNVKLRTTEFPTCSKLLSIKENYVDIDK